MGAAELVVGARIALWLGVRMGVAGVVLPRLERRIGCSWIAATIVVAVWAAEHACYPLLESRGGVDLGFAAYRFPARRIAAGPTRFRFQRPPGASGVPPVRTVQVLEDGRPVERDLERFLAETDTTADLLNTGRSPGSAAVGFQGAGRSLH
jgi:hypothetical protein